MCLSEQIVNSTRNEWNIQLVHCILLREYEIISGEKHQMIGIKHVRNKFMVAFHLSPSVTLLYKKQIEIKL